MSKGTPSDRMSDHVVRRLLERIRDGELQPGDRLPNERELAAELGVSRPVVREAMSNLAGRGVVTARAGSGSTVTAVAADRAGEALALHLAGSGRDYREIHEVRELLEVHAAGVAAERATQEQALHLAELVDRLQNSESLTDRAEADLAFHTYVTEITGNSIFGLILGSVHHGLIEVRTHNLALPAARHEAIRSHRAIQEAIASHDELSARMAMAAHLHAVIGFWRDGLTAGRTASASAIDTRDRSSDSSPK